MQHLLACEMKEGACSVEGLMTAKGINVPNVFKNGEGVGSHSHKFITHTLVKSTWHVLRIDIFQTFYQPCTGVYNN